MLRALLVLGLSIGLVGCGGDDSTAKKSNSAPATCTAAQANNTRCSGTIVQQCNGSTWATVQNCTTTSQVCTPTTSTAAACTTPISTTCTSAQTDFERCNNNSIELCNGTDWVASQNCTTTSQVCTPSGNAATCETAVTTACDDTTATYACDGTAVVYCGETTAQIEHGETLYDCAAYGVGDGTQAGVCFNYGGEWEADCVFQTGEVCAGSSDGQTMDTYFGCGPDGVSASYACDQNDGCVSYGGPGCDPNASALEAQCDGTRFLVNCVGLGEYGIPQLVNCASADFGSGSCNASNPGCEHSTSGGPCTEGADMIPIRCIGGLTCQGISDGVGSCG